jgi:hypothetical protein
LVSKIPFIKVIASGANTRLVGMTPEEIKKVRESSPEQLATGFEKNIEINMQLFRQMAKNIGPSLPKRFGTFG